MSKTDKDMSPATLLTQAGRKREYTGGGRVVTPPVWHGSTILFDTVEELRGSRPNLGEYQYGRNGTPTQWALSEALTALEPGAASTRLYPSGVAAVSAAILSVVSAGDEILVIDTAYAPTRSFCDGMLKRFGVTTRYYDPALGAGIADLFTDKTRAVFLESPGSLTFEVQDLPAVIAACKARGIATILDNTWATPLYLPAIALGCDLSVLACTKYIGGHSDVMMGSVTATAEYAARLNKTSQALGHVVAPDDAFLALRGLRTLAIRMARHQDSGLKVANWLADQPQVARVLHPALPSCPGHDYWKRDFKGAAGLFAFVLKGGDSAARDRLIESLSLFGIGFSWGGFESLATPSDPIGLRSATRWQAEGPAIRISIGLEEADDLIADLAQALGAYPAG